MAASLSLVWRVGAACSCSGVCLPQGPVLHHGSRLCQSLALDARLALCRPLCSTPCRHCTAAMNELTWQRVMDWEQLHRDECCDPTLLRFQGKPDQLRCAGLGCGHYNSTGTSRPVSASCCCPVHSALRDVHGIAQVRSPRSLTHKAASPFPRTACPSAWLSSGVCPQEARAACPQPPFCCLCCLD